MNEVESAKNASLEETEALKSALRNAEDALAGLELAPGAEAAPSATSEEKPEAGFSPAYTGYGEAPEARLIEAEGTEAEGLTEALISGAVLGSPDESAVAEDEVTESEPAGQNPEGRAQALAEAEQALTEARQAREAAEAENARLTEAMAEAEKALAEAQEAGRTAQTEKEDLNKTLAEAESALAEARKAAETAQAERETLAVSLKEAEDALEAQKAEISALNQKVAELTEENETLSSSLNEAQKANTDLTASLAAEEAEKAQLSARIEELNAALSDEEAKNTQLTAETETLAEQNQLLEQQAADLQGAAELDERLITSMPAPRLSWVKEEMPSIDWARIRLNSDGYPQLWLRATNDRGMNSLLIYREYTDENGTLQQKLYTRYPLNGEKISVRYRTLTEPGAYSVVISDTAGEYQTFGVLTTVEDIDGNGVIDTVTHAGDHITLLELQNAFSGAEPK